MGRYSDLTAAVVSIALVFSAIAAHLLPGLLGIDTAWLDNVSLLAIGVILGQRAATNGAGQLAVANTARLDAIGAPSTAVIDKAAAAAIHPAPAAPQ